MVNFQHQTTNQFQHWLHIMLHQQRKKGVHYLVPIHKNIKYADWSKTQSRYNRCVSYVMKQ